MKSGKTQGSIAATFEWTDMEGNNPILTESRVMTFYSDPKLRYFDVDITLTALASVTFGDGKDGAFGIRLRPVLQEDKGVSHITNAEGLVGEKQLWGKPSAWCDYSGEINGEKVGVAILDHPENPRHPVRWHARAYGLFAANPWGLSVFTNDKSQDGVDDHRTRQEPALPLSRNHSPGYGEGRRHRRPLHEVRRRTLVSLASWKRRLRPRPLIQQLEIRDLAARALAFQERLRQAKSEVALPDPGWYPWDSFGTLTLLDQLLTGRHRFLEPLHRRPSRCSISAAAMAISHSSSSRSAAASAPSITRLPITTAWRASRR